jgi:dTDP-4-amino-4,6-dideoxygalactose transaminase
VDIGSSYLTGEVIAAFLWAQMEEAESITEKRRAIWWQYHHRLAPLEAKGMLRRPIIPEDCQHNAHMYYILLESLQKRSPLIHFLKEQGVNTVFHYVPLHGSPAGIRYGRVSGSMANTESVSGRLLRLPMWVGLGELEIERTARALEQAIGACHCNPIGV